MKKTLHKRIKSLLGLELLILLDNKLKKIRANSPIITERLNKILSFRKITLSSSVIKEIIVLLVFLNVFFLGVMVFSLNSKCSLNSWSEDSSLTYFSHESFGFFKLLHCLIIIVFLFD